MKGLVRKLMNLPAGQIMAQLPPEHIAPLALVLRDLRKQAEAEARIVQSRGCDEDARQWKIVAGYARNLLHTFKRAKRSREHELQIDRLLSDIGFAPRHIDGYVGAQMFRTPSASKSRCVVEVDYDAFAPWIEAGDLVELDLTAFQVNDTGLYVVAVNGECLAVRGFHRRGTYGFYIHEDGSMQPKTIHMQDNRVPEGYEIVGRVAQVYKRSQPIGDAQ